MKGGHRAQQSIQAAVPDDRIVATALCYPMGVLSRGNHEIAGGAAGSLAGRGLGDMIGGTLGSAAGDLGDVGGAAAAIGAGVQEEHSEIILALGEKALYILNQPQANAMHRWSGLQVLESVPRDGLSAQWHHDGIDLDIVLTSAQTGKTYEFQSKLLRSGLKELAEAIGQG